MGIPPLTKSEIEEIKKLRETGHSLPEIKRILNRGYGTIFRYIKDVPILPEYHEIWKIKRGGSKARSAKLWSEAKVRASELIGPIGFKERLLILSSLYWGEGNKAELNLINSDPNLVRVIVMCLKDLGIQQNELKISLRLFEDIDIKKAISFWSKTLYLPRGFITKIDIKKGKKVGKLRYGMCRVRVKKAGKNFKLIMSMIDLIKSGI
ncbi:MAG: hypothetical protein A3H52_03125 [Candidatus Zambryskibacteria bacterium RIFCSPLOWO2_02_FULL_39_26]|uniref:Transposase IS30-like HTH domain-containing protein n=1 Tax=Candidatus Zambryskibacteria bacterium RIFCSPLOWO2_12_FULL_39_23 TaxID=1802776 RepID=A0A1G2UTR6_9BACT|nr:MAG: hypothetical protein A2W51_02900 [Candidatus Zambryskibacteria bacterium RIFCSPHIGHO2_02_39_10]OHA98965.1 MAG: hypothetical protein A3E59_00980 [Candidatus Zambryskibacteria bacterium RIFCSPHIGHO2_12_FULL_39_47]OHB10577.1 MAG: hypothetical protein A3H52_03125 [Candidatus Zambryskibacteria bacterium RIFCSPLOWO2_02_FULL_39_26]OHB12790.1 MAG: hypothetical protein A3G99_01425 [Candidatus Zambryskibacteria bacterium RIFCSPLOWO2_12_FULL_39_23]